MATPKKKPTAPQENPQPKEEAKLFNNKYYRTVNIDLKAEEAAAAQTADMQLKAKVMAMAKLPTPPTQKKLSKVKAKASTHPEEYKTVLRGMGFKID